jgi:hypothetical protein
VGGTDGDTRIREIIYDPLPSQKRFHASGARFKGFSGPIGSGKSQALCQEAIRLSYMNPGRLGLLGAPTYPMLRDATQATLFEILEGNEIPFDYNKAENTLVMQETRSRMLFRPVDEFERLRGTNLAWFGLDELTYTQEAAWLRLEGRLRDPKARRLCGFAVWTPKGFDWVYRKFISDLVEGYTSILAPPLENRHLLQQIPDFYERLERSYGAKFYQQEVLGLYLNMTGGKVFSSFSREDNIQNVELDPRLPLMWANDFNVDPLCSVIAQMQGKTLKVLEEIVIRDGTTQEACAEFLRRHDGHQAGVILFGDASGYQKQTTGMTDYDVIRQYLAAHSNLVVTPRAPRSNPPVRDRINLTNAKLRTAAGEVGLVMSPECKELIKDFEEVGYKPETGAVDKDRDRMRTHLSDALGYLLWQEYMPQPKAGERGDGWIFN